MLGWFKQTRVHFIGIGGIGMSGIAEILLDFGYTVSGSDIGQSSVIENLALKGAKIFNQHLAENVNATDIIVYSSAIDHKNPEIIRAKELGLPIIKRAEMLAELMRLKLGVAVAGSHGKTTTTSLIATMFQQAKLDATYVIGGIVRNLGGNAKKGNGDFLIAEADESDGSFLHLSPIMAVVTNIDNDHLDFYGTQEKIVENFLEFVNKVPFYGKIALNIHDKYSVDIKDKIKRPILWYGIDTIGADYEARDVVYSAQGTTFKLYFKKTFVDHFETHLLGLHNVLNTLGAISISHQCGLSFEEMKHGLLHFNGVGRRLEKIYQQNQTLVLDDYGHHPTEIRATISTLKNLETRPLTVIFEPHRYSRTQNFWNEFTECFDGVEELFLAPIYAASEAEIPGITSEKLAEKIKTMGIKVTLIANLDHLDKIIEPKLKSPHVILGLGAGNISKKLRQAVQKL